MSELPKKLRAKVEKLYISETDVGYVYTKNHEEIKATRAGAQALWSELEPILRECEGVLAYIEKNCELVAYELVGGDGAPMGHLPYPHEMEFILKTLTKLQSLLGESDEPN